MQLDLRQDARKIRRYLERRIRDYPVSENLGPGEDADPIRLLTLGYALEQSAFVALVFDTRPKADNDGQWTLHIENNVNVLRFPKWEQAFAMLCDGGRVEVTLPDGSPHTLDENDDNESVAQLFGEMLRDTLLSLRDAGALTGLPLDPKAFGVIEEFYGNWGWPEYDERKKLGRLKAK